MAAASYMDFFVSPEFIDSCAVAPQLCLDYVLSPAVPADELMYYQDAWSQGCASSGTVCSVVAGALYYTANFQFNTDLAGADTVTEGVSLSAVLPADALPMLTTTKPSLVLWGEADTAFDTEAMLAQFCAHARADLFIERFPGVDHFDSVRHHSVLSKVRSWLEGSREESFGPTGTACSDGGLAVGPEGMRWWIPMERVRGAGGTSCFSAAPSLRLGPQPAILERGALSPPRGPAVVKVQLVRRAKCCRARHSRLLRYR